MKYVCIEVTVSGIKRNLPIIFPNCFVHKDVADYMCVLIGQRQNIDAKPVSAGEVNFVGNRVVVSGESETLGLASRGIDAYLIGMNDYNAGIV